MSEDILTPSPDEVDEALNPPDVQDGDNSTPESDIESADPSEHSNGESRISSGSGEETKANSDEETYLSVRAGGLLLSGGLSYLQLR